ncbi:MAG TPA: hypothetical protein VL527_00480 [Dongiaceae bacterium]|nr:hypothetical protein [Dongiaceae bacterium]
MPSKPSNNAIGLKEVAPAYSTGGEVDLSLLQDSLPKSPWERMQANDDALNFAETLRSSMERRNAKSQRTNMPLTANQ